MRENNGILRDNDTGTGAVLWNDAGFDGGLRGRFLDFFVHKRQWKYAKRHLKTKTLPLEKKKNPRIPSIFLILLGIRFPRETSHPLVAFISLHFLSFLCRCTRCFENRVVRYSFGGDVFEQGVGVEVVRHPFVKVCVWGRGQAELVNELQGGMKGTDLSRR